ncbi:hypothetical protein LUZ60_001974 [Juncus effusus]|nr:hypothetical protein LUZ60_001974 [Juncus effusus]
MIVRWNLVKNLNRFYQQARAVRRFYSQTLVGANQSEISSKVDPFSLVADELSLIATQLREDVAQVVKNNPDPKLASAADCFIKRAQENNFRPTVALLMASAFNTPISESLRARQQFVIKSTEVFYVVCLLHDYKIPGLEYLKPETLMTGDTLLADVARGVAQLKNPQVYDLFAKLTRATGTKGAIQVGATCGSSMESYLETMYYKNAAFTSTSCEAVAILAGQPDEVSVLASEYGKNLGQVCQLTNDIPNFSGKKDVLGKDVRSNIIHPLEHLGKTGGIESSKQFALEYANRAKEIIEAFPYCNDERVLISRRALIDLPFMAIRTLK